MTTATTIRTSLHVGLPTAEDMGECVAIVATHCPGATVTPAQGVWQGEVEHAAVVTILHPDSPTWAVRVDALCRHLCDTLRQSCILVCDEPVTSHTYAPRLTALAAAY